MLSVYKVPTTLHTMAGMPTSSKTLQSRISVQSKNKCVTNVSLNLDVIFNQPFAITISIGKPNILSTSHTVEESEGGEK